MAQTTSKAPRTSPPPESAKDTMISVFIAFTLAFVFRGFVIEAFVIPTGSMGPTLNGAHMKWRGPATGREWSVGPWDANPQNSLNYVSVQTGQLHGGSGITVFDPASGDSLNKRSVPLSSGDRILVLKYLYNIQPPARYDVVVFKNPTDPSQNYIKRLIGLPGEEIALVDGDVFSRSGPSGGSQPSSPGNAADVWASSGWTIARKPRHIQEALWQPVFDSGYAPMDFPAERAPWRTTDGSPAWTMVGRSYQPADQKGSDTSAAGEFVFDQTRQRVSSGRRLEKWTIDDYYPYDEQINPNTGNPNADRFPVSDLRVRLDLVPGAGDGSGATCRLKLRGHEFELDLGGGKADIRMKRIVGDAGVLGPWTSIGSGAAPAMKPGVPVSIEFWHSDQSLRIIVEGKQVAQATYDWSPAERVLYSTGKPLADILATQQGTPQNVLRNVEYRKPEVRVGVRGARRIFNFGLDRDLHYQPATLPGGSVPALATSPLNHLTLGPAEFFCCGDNSPASLDGRLWDRVDDWVNYEFRPSPTQSIRAGVVPRELMLGKAFFVYWPAPHSADVMGVWLPVPDFGRMRFIW